MIVDCVVCAEVVGEVVVVELVPEFPAGGIEDVVVDAVESATGRPLLCVCDAVLRELAISAMEAVSSTAHSAAKANPHLCWSLVLSVGDWGRGT